MRAGRLTELLTVAHGDRTGTCTPVRPRAPEIEDLENFWAHEMRTTHQVATFVKLATLPPVAWVAVFGTVAYAEFASEVAVPEVGHFAAYVVMTTL